VEHIEYLSPVTLQTFLTAAAGVLLVVLLVRWLIGPPAAIARRPGLYILRGLILLVLAALLLNPVRVQELPGSVDPPDVYCLLDSSHSMAMGTPATRWDESLRTIREADALGTRSHARLHLFRFGQKLAAIDPAQLGLDGGQRSTARAKSLPAVGPTDADTQLAGALRQVSSRFGRALPAGVVLFSDGRARDEADVEKTARYLAKLGVAIHVVPVGDTGRGGDVAIEGVVAPTRVRRRSQVHVQAYLRSYGYDGRRADVVLSSVGEPGGQPRKLESRPIVLQSGKQTVDLTFQSEVQMRKLEVSIAPQEDEISTDNNRLTTDIEIDRTKIRVLFIEGNRNS
jgi:hypothetical protein